MTTGERHSIRYAQNFLTSRQLVERLLDRSSIHAPDLVYEIGPGRGIITEQLAKRGCRVVAVEQDPFLARQLRRRFAGLANVAIVEADFLRHQLPALPYKVFANIPFNITASIVAKLTGTARPPDDTYLVMQRQAAHKFLGQPRESLASVLLKPWFAPTVAYHFRRTDFVPVPQVDAVLLRMLKRGPPLIAVSDRQWYRDFVIYSFTNWQPSLAATLAPLFGRPRWCQLARALTLDDAATPTSLHFEQWLALFACFQDLGSTRARQRVHGAERRLRERQARLRKVHRTRRRCSLE